MSDVSLSHRDVARAAPAPDADRPGVLSSPPAQRLQVRRWRDPRLWFGVLLVAGAVLAGAALFASADDTVPVWAADDDVRAGMPLGPEDVHAVRVAIDGGRGAEAYLQADQPFPPGLLAHRDLSAGELLAASALDDARPSPDRLPLAVTAGGLPAELGVGDLVDVWAVPGDESADRSAGTGGSSRQVLDDVTVSSVGAQPAGGIDASREVLVALPSRADVGTVLDALRGADVVLVLVGE